MAELYAEQDLSADRKIEILQELIACGDPVPLWVYGEDFHLARAGSDRLVFHTIFEHTGCLKYMKEHFLHQSGPLILSSQMGLMWGAVRGSSLQDGIRHKTYYVIGPVINVEMSLTAISEAVRKYDVNLSWRTGFTDLMRSIPVVGTSIFFQYTLMLHYCACGEKLSRSNIAFQQSGEPDRPEKEDAGEKRSGKDRSLTYRTECALLDNVRQGNLNYERDLEMAGSLSEGLGAGAGDPLQQAILSAVTFVSLCTRAAIEGGLSPDAAYTVGDGYIRNLTACSTLTDVRTINHAMYEDFIKRVHRLRMNPAWSVQIKSCIEYIELHLTEVLTIGDLARRVSYTEYYLSHKFKEETGLSINTFIRNARIERAKALLAGTDLPVSKIAEELHFCSSSYFSTRFQETVGMLPARYRKENRRV